MIALVLVEAIPLLCESLARLLEREEGIVIQGRYTRFCDAATALSDTQPDLLWLDGDLAEIQEAGLVKMLRQQYPGIQILLFGSVDSIPAIKNFYRQGICAYLPKTTPVEEIRHALEEVIAGHVFIPVALNRSLATWLTTKNRKKKPLNNELTRREKEVLQLIMDEYTTREIASKLFISHCTVETHRINLIQKLGVKNTAGMVRVAFEYGLFDVGG